MSSAARKAPLDGRNDYRVSGNSGAAVRHVNHHP